MHLRQAIHEYQGYNGQVSQCRLTFYRNSADISVVIATEIPINTGTPIREISDHVATQAYRLIFAPNAMFVDKFIYIEHAPVAQGETKYAYTRVEFDWDDEGLRFIRPERLVLSEAEVLELVGGKL